MLPWGKAARATGAVSSGAGTFRGACRDIGLSQGSERCRGAKVSAAVRCPETGSAAGCSSGSDGETAGPRAKARTAFKGILRGQLRADGFANSVLAGGEPARFDAARVSNSVRCEAISSLPNSKATSAESPVAPAP